MRSMTRTTRTTRTTLAAASALGGGALLALAAPLAAQAHVNVTPASTAAGAYTVLTFSSAHGCEGSPTTAFTVDIPEGVESVAPTLKAGWAVEKVMVDLDEPIDDGHGNTITERVGQVVYTAGTPVPDGYRDTLEIQLQLPEDAAGERLEFPVLQQCEVGETAWNESPAADGTEPEHPAPAIEVTEAVADGDGHAHDDATESTGHAASDDPADAESTAATTGDDVLARALGVAGLAVGVVGIVLAVNARRSGKA
jgi:periplasmic copper chaperone A